MTNPIGYGKIYEVTWWGDGVDNNKGWGFSYVALAIYRFTQMTNLTWSRLTNLLWQA